MKNLNHTIEPKFDLLFQRVVQVDPAKLFEGWTNSKIIPEWFCPRPWKVVDCKIDLRPGGAFNFTMKSPEGELFPNLGCILDFELNKRLVWTSALQENFRPVLRPESNVDFQFTGHIRFEKTPEGTLYTAVGIHADEESKKSHESMGFQEGWGICLDQLVEFWSKNPSGL